MARLTTYLLAGGTIACALGIGYVMQYGTGPAQTPETATAPVAVTEIELASSATGAPRLPGDPSPAPALPQAPAERVAAEAAVKRPSTADALPRGEPEAGIDCAVTFQGRVAAGAMVDLMLDAPCHASERVTLHHHGLRVTDVVQPDGTLQVSMPAMARRASFIASFSGGDGATATADVDALEFYDRVAVQWKGDAGLQLHAREFDAAYFSDGHVWAASAGDLSAAAKGEGGFLTRLGRADAPGALLAEVYTFPTGTARRDGEVRLSVEAKITEANCDSSVSAQTFQVSDDGGVHVHDLSFEMPDCENVGDFLVLKNLLADLKIASR